MTEFGRYLDTGMDFLGNLALFLALGLRTGFLEKALLAFLVFTLVQSYDFNLERLYRLSRGLPLPEGPRDPETPWLRLFRGLYALLFAPRTGPSSPWSAFSRGGCGLTPRVSGTRGPWRGW